MNLISKVHAAATAFARYLGGLGLSPADKWAHFLVGGVLQAVLVLLLGFDALTAAALVLIMELLKEWGDSIDGGTPDPQDVIATMYVPVTWVLLEMGNELLKATP